MIGFFILLFVMIGVWVLLLGVADTSEISKNWPKYRCNPSIMPFASFFGHDTTENFNFCLGGMMNVEMGGFLSPIFKILSTFLITLSTLMGVANNIRLEVATFMGGINTIFQNFTDRFMQLSTNIRTSTVRIRMLMGRLYGTFFSLMFMSLSATRGMINFGDTFLFKFLDTFCFDPETLIDVLGKGRIPMKDVKVDDVFLDGSKVTSTFAFLADGQPMVEFPGSIKVSTNHYVSYKGRWVRSDKHPDAISIEEWSGGSTRPLICFNTSTHRIPVGQYLFLDYDETSEGDQETMSWVEGRVNASPMKHHRRSFDYNCAFAPSTAISLKSGQRINASSVQLGDELSFGKVIACIKKKTDTYCTLPSGDFVTPGLLIWDPKLHLWFRAGDRYTQIIDPLERDYISFIVASTSTIELASGVLVRDYFEVPSPETEQFYAKAIEQASLVLAE